MTSRAKRKSGTARADSDAFTGYIQAVQSGLAALSTDHGFDNPEIDVHIPECQITYKRPSLWVTITFEYPGEPFCTLRIEREDKAMQWVGFDDVASAYGLNGWKMPASKPSLDTAAAVVISNKDEIVAVVRALQGSGVQEKLHALLWRPLS
jgi:hypothetical protein